MALAKAKTGAGKLAAPTKSARRDNPLCGDRVTSTSSSTARARSPRSPIRCAAACCARPRPRRCRRSPSAATPPASPSIRHDAERAIGREAGKAHEPFDAFAPVANHKSRQECVLLPFEALKDALS